MDVHHITAWPRKYCHITQISMCVHDYVNIDQINKGSASRLCGKTSQSNADSDSPYFLLANLTTTFVAANAT